MKKKTRVRVHGAIRSALLVLVAFSASTVTPVFASTTGLECLGQPVTIVGTEGNDSIVGTPNPDVIAALGGNDRVQALGGDDAVCGGDGNDLTSGNDGDDIMGGGDG